MEWIAPAPYRALLHELVPIIKNRRRSESFIIGIDGWMYSGKSSLASWLAWQLGCQAVYLDMFIVADNGTFAGWRVEDLRRIFVSRTGRCTIVEGVMLLEALHRIQVAPDYLVYARDAGRRNRPTGSELSKTILAYLMQRRPMSKADRVVNLEMSD